MGASSKNIAHFEHDSERRRIFIFSFAFIGSAYPVFARLKAVKGSFISIRKSLSYSFACLFLLLFLNQLSAQTTQTFTSSGTFIPPAGVTSVTVQAWGGGGAGGGNNSTNGTGGGGGGGAYNTVTGVSVTAGNSYTITIGAGGVPGTNSGNGGVTSAILGSTVSANGGSGGTFSATNGAGGAGGTGGTRNGGSGSNGSSGVYGGGGGGSAGTAANGNSVTATATGATAVTGGGPGGNGMSGTSGNGSAPASGPGGGGGGCRASSTARMGGNGFAGQVIITYTCPVYSLTSPTSATSVCVNTNSTVTLTSSAAGLPVGTYTITYSRSLPNATGLTAAMTVSTAGTGTFTATGFTTAGNSTITITNIASGSCTNAISSNNTATIVVTQPPSQPSIITGAITPCQGSTQSYSVTDVAGVTYTWSYSGTGATIASGQGTNSISVNYAAGATSGTWTVTPSNSCGNGTTRTLAVTMASVPAQPSVVTGNTSPCQGTSQTYSVTNVAGVTYTWSFPAGWTQTGGGTSNSVVVTVGANSGNITVTPSNVCGNGVARALAVTPTTVPSQPSVISGSSTPCQSSSQTYSVTNVAGVTYTWSFPAGWIQTGGGTSNSVVVTVGANSGNITVTPSNTCGNGTAIILPVIISTLPAQPTNIIGNNNPCLGSSQNYSVTNIAGESYAWTFPAGWVITAGQSTNSVTVTVGATAGTISVTPSNVCGIGTPKTLAVTIATLPAQTSIISPSTPNICQNSVQNYLVNPPPPAGVTYTWSGPAGSTILSGQGTNVIQIRYGNTSGNLTITPSNVCGNGPSQSMAISITTSVPVQPGVITGPIAPCVGTTQTYTVPVVSGVIYAWTVPAGWNITSGQGSNTITTVVGATAGNIEVIAGNSCGGSAPRLYAVTPQLTTPVQPSVITGTTQICQGSTQTYSVVNVPFVVYTWSVPAGWSIVSGQGTSSINATVGASSGNISVTPSNDCGNGGIRTLAVTIDAAVPNDPGAINGSNNPCENSTQVYSVNAQAGVTYTWSVPAGSNITAGQGTNSITVVMGASSGNIVVTPTNTCGTGPSKTLGIVVRLLPASSGLITGNTLFCEASTQTYSLVNVAGNTYNWVVPAGWAIVSGQGTNLISATAGVTSGNIQVIPSNACGAGPSSSLAVTVNPLPAAFTGPDQVNCAGLSVQIGGAAIPGNTYSWTSVPVGFTSTLSNPVVTPAVNTTYTLTETNPATGCSKTRSVNLVANQIIAVTVTPTSQTICTGNATNIAISSNISNTAFTWAPVLTSGSGTSGFANGSGAVIAQAITNTSSAPSVVTYTITATANLCVNSMTTVAITVNPAPVVAGQTKSVCSGAPIAITLGASTNGVAATTYTITNIQTNGLTASAGSPATGTGLAANVLVDDVWTNTTLTPEHVIYTVVPVSASGCSGAPFTIDVTVSPKPVITNQPSKEICSGLSTNINLTSNIAASYSWTIGAITGGITGASAGSGNLINQVLTNPGNAAAGTVQYIVTPTSTAGSCAGAAFTITVTVNPSPVVTNAASYTLCSGQNTNRALTSSAPSTFSWTIGTITGGITGASAGSGSSINQVLTNPSNATPGTVQYVVSATFASGGCAGNPFVITYTVDPIPTVTAGASQSAICPGAQFNLNSSSSLTFTTTNLIAENFNAGTNSWTKINNSTGGTPTNAAWTLRPNNYSYGGLTFRSNDNSQFYLSNSDAQGSAGTTATILRSPAINTSGYTSLSLDFFHYYRHEPGSTIYVEVSTDNTIWVSRASYTVTQGSSSNFAHPVIDLTAYINNPTLYIRFRYQAPYGYYWAIDNVTVTGTVGATQPIISWTSSPAGFTSSQANPIDISQAVTTTYNVSYTNPISGCSNNASTTVTSLMPPAPSIVADYCAVPGRIQLTASGANSYLWNTGATTSVIVVDIAGQYSVTGTDVNGCSTVVSQNVSNELVVNGNFSAGNTGFTSGYANDQTANGLYAPESEYAIYNNAQFTHSNFWGRDHTSGTGTGNANFMIVNGAKFSPQPVVWQQTVTVVPNTDYYFSAWSISLNDVAPFAKLRFEVNGVQLGTTAILTAGVNNVNNPWLSKDRFYGSWNSGAATTATIRIIDLETAAGGNDFGLDDISFGTLSPLPFSFNPKADTVCEGQTMHLTSNVVGGMPPYHFSWSGPNGFTSTLQNPVVNNILPSGMGTYTLTMYDSYGCTPQTKTVNVIVNPAPTATLVSSGNGCQYGAAPLLTFTANGGKAPYTFAYNINGGANQTLTTFGTSNISMVFAPTVSLGTFVYKLVSVTDSLGCTRTINTNTTVIVRPLPVSSITGNSPLCPGSTGNIFTGNSGMSAYKWWISGNGSIPGNKNSITADVTTGDTCNRPIKLDLEVTDANGCSAIAEESFLVNDIIAPVIQNCVPPKTYIAPDVTIISPLVYSETPVVITASSFNNEGGAATDNCSINTYSYRDTRSGTAPIIVNRTFTITDKCGNSSTCIQVITINSVVPDITCVNAPSVNVAAATCTAVVNPQEPTVNAGNPITWSWVMTGATTGSGTGVIDDHTFNAGVTTITWTATNVSGTDVCSQQITVVDNIPPALSALPKEFCVLDIDTAFYYDPTIDITPTRPDFYVIKPGDIALDLNPATFSDNCTPVGNLVIHWRIDFNGGTPAPVSGTGQPSLYPSNIIIPGHVTDDRIHTITYWLMDAAGNESVHVTVNITIKPRPNIIKM